MITVKSKMLIAKMLLYWTFSLFVDAPQAMEIREEFKAQEQVTQSQTSLQEQNFHDAIPRGMETAEEVIKKQRDIYEKLHHTIFQFVGLIITPPDAELALNLEKLGIGDFQKAREMGDGLTEYFMRLISAACLLQTAHAYLGDFSAKLEKALIPGPLMSGIIKLEEVRLYFITNYMKKLKDTPWWYEIPPSVQQAFEEALKIKFNLVEKTLAAQKKSQSEESEILLEWWQKISKKNFNTPLKDCTAFCERLFGKYSYWDVLKAFNKHINNYNEQPPTMIRKLYDFFTGGESVAKKNLSNSLSYGEIDAFAHQIFLEFRTRLYEKDPKLSSELYGCNTCTNSYRCDCFGGEDSITHIKRTFSRGSLALALMSLKNEEGRLLDWKLLSSEAELYELKFKFANVKFKVVSLESLLKFLEMSNWEHFFPFPLQDLVVFS